MREDAPATREQLSNCSEKEDPETAVKAPETVVSVTIPLYPPTHKQQKASASQAKMQVMPELEQSSGLPGAYREEGIDQGAYDEMKMEPLRPTAVDADAFGRNFHPAPSSNMSTGVSSLLEQSIISGISDGVSSITFGDDYHFHHRHKNPSYSYSHAPTNPPGRKRQASEGTSMFGMHHRKFVPAYAMSPIKKAAPIHDNNSDAMDVEQQMQPAYQQPLPPAAHAPNNMMLGCHQKEMEQSQNRSTTRSHVSDMSAGAFSVSMNSLPSIGSFASVSV